MSKLMQSSVVSRQSSVFETGDWRLGTRDWLAGGLG